MFWCLLSYFYVFEFCLMASCVCLFLLFLCVAFVLLAFVAFAVLCLLSFKLKLGRSGKISQDRPEATFGGRYRRTQDTKQAKRF